MQKIKDYLTNPATRISFMVFVFGIGAVWANTNSRIDILEQKVNKIDQIGIETQLAELKIDMQWIKTTLEEIKRAM